MGTFIVIVIIGTIAAAVISGIAAAKASVKARNEIVASPKFKEIANYIFSGGRRPSRIVITFNNEIFFGPVDGGKFLQVPGTMIPSMHDDQRHGLGGAFEKQYAYRYNRCNSGQSVGGAPADTGNEYIDTHADVLLISYADSASSW